MSIDPADLLADALDGSSADPFAVGTVTEILAPKVRVNVRGGSKMLPRLASYTPTVGDPVLIACVPGAWCVVGRFAT